MAYDPYASVASILAQFDIRLTAAEAGAVPVTLGTLSLSTALTSGTAVSGNILGATSGSTLATSTTGLSINSAARTFTFDGTAAGGTAIAITETLAGAVGSPKTNPLGTVAAAGGTVVRTMFMGQSENEYILNPAPFYRSIAQPTPGNGNLILFYQGAPGAAPVRTVVNSTSVTAGQVNPAMAAVSAMLAYNRPGYTFALGDLSVAGTSRFDLADDTTNGSDGRLWADFTSVITALESEFGTTQNLIECWYNADAGSITTFKSAFWPLYFGSTAAGANFALGGTNAGREIDHCIYDGQAAANAKGRGVFTRSDTKWNVITPMPFLDAPDSSTGGVEMQNFSSNNARLTEPARATVIALPSDTLAASTSLTVGPSAHIAKFGGASTSIHPDVGNKDGQILYAWPLAINMLRASGMTIGEPVIASVECAADGSYADLLVTLPNGGTLKTLASQRGTTYGGTSPHQQAVTGVEITRSGGERRPVFRTDQTSYPASHRGTVAIIDSGTGTGVARRGKVRITPSTPFAFGDSLSYLRGQGTAMLVQPRDLNLYPWFLIEHIPSMFDASALYPFEGIAVQPAQVDLSIPVPTASFTPRGVFFDGGDYFTAANLTSPAAATATSNGIMSCWFRNNQTTWNTPVGAAIFGFRAGSNTVLTMNAAASGRMNFQLKNDTATDSINVYAGAGTTAFVPNQWYHILVAWTATALNVYVNDVLVGSLTYASVDMAGLNLTHVGVGATTAATNPWVGDLGHLYINVAETLDMSVTANRRKFVNNSMPVDMGNQGALPTGTRPAYYFDGLGAAWNNQGSASAGTQTGALTASTAPPAY